MDLVVGPIIEVVKCVGRPTLRYLKHQKKFKENLEKFKGRKEDLCSQKCDIESRLDTELRDGKVAKEEVQTWLKDVKEFIARQDVEDEVNGWGCLSCCCRVKILEERAQELKEIYDRGEKYNKLPDSEVIKAEILALLKGDVVTKLGVWGMGGVGKTTIMKHVRNELLKEGKFKKIIWLCVSQNFDIFKLQEKIACSLKETLEELQNATNRAAVLSKMLEKQKPYLLILDDVWRSFRLEEVGIPEPHVADGCKLVLTTRSQEIVRSMDCKRIRVDTLSQEEALKLFLNKVGDSVLSDHGGGIKNDLEPTLKEIVDECHGLPLAIVTVAGSLKETSEPWLWSVALNQLRDCKRNVAGTDDDDDDDDAFRILKFSYDRLKNPKIQYCFLYCALYPEDYNIPKENIIEYWIDEGFIDEMETRHAMKDEGHHILRKLEDNSLLEFEDEEDCVRMHDLIRDMALHITRSHPRFLVEAGKALRELPEKVKCTEDVEKISLMWNYIEEIPLSMASSTCRRLTTLLLAHNSFPTIPESVFEHMPELKILDLSFNEKLRSLPRSVSKLVNLTALLLRFTSLTEVPSLLDIRALKKLDLGGTKIKEVPKGLEMCANLKYLDLSNLSGFIEVADSLLSNLSNLQQLFLDEGRGLKGEVIGRLKKLEAFVGLFPTVHEMSTFLKCFLDQGDTLSGYFIRVGESHSYAVENVVPKRELEKFMQFAGVDILGENMLLPPVQIFIARRGKMKVFPSAMLPVYLYRLEDIYVYSCEQVEEIIASDLAEREEGGVVKLILPKLKRLHLELLPALKSICSTGVKMVCDSLEHIQILQCCDLDNLNSLFEVEGISKSAPPPGICPSLKTITIGYCYKIKKLFPSWMLQGNLQSLEEICVDHCVQMEEIISLEQGGKEGLIKLTLPKLRRLKLIYLPTLKRICSSRAVMMCDSLEHVEILLCFHLENLDALFKAVNFSTVKTIWINGCGKIKKLFPSGNLQSLEEINVGCCEQMEELVEKEVTKDLSLPKLKRLRLECLPALKIHSTTTVMACLSLEEIQILACQRLRRIPLYHLDNLDAPFKASAFSKSPQAPAIYSSLKTISIIECGKIKKLLLSRFLLGNLQSLEEIIVRDCEQMEEIIALEPEDEEEAGEVVKLILPKLKKLHLELLPALKNICNTRVKVACDYLEHIQILQCHHLDNLDDLFEVEGNSMSSPPPGICSSLKTIRIDGCSKIKKLFPSRLLLGYLQSLEEINVRFCEQMEELVASNPEGGELVMDLILPKLKWVELEGLPALKSI